jgi:hypothetical protein
MLKQHTFSLDIGGELIDLPGQIFGGFLQNVLKLHPPKTERLIVDLACGKSITRVENMFKYIEENQVCQKYTNSSDHIYSTDIPSLPPPPPGPTIAHWGVI